MKGRETGKGREEKGSEGKGRGRERKVTGRRIGRKGKGTEMGSEGKGKVGEGMEKERVGNGGLRLRDGVHESLRASELESLRA